LRVGSTQLNTNPEQGERSSGPDHEPAPTREPSCSTSQVSRNHSQADNVWSLLRHGTSSWAVLARLLVLLLGIMTVFGFAVSLVYLLDMQVAIAGVEIGSVSSGP